MNKEIIRSMVKGAYDLQKVRIQSGLRLVANFRTRLGIVQDKDDETGTLDLLRNEYARITDAIVSSGKSRTKVEKYLIHDGIISTEADYILVKTYIKLLEDEETLFKDIKSIIRTHPLWINYLAGVRGYGETMAAVIISEFDIHKARYASSLHAYAGLDTVIINGKGKGRSRLREHLVEQTYITKDGEEKTKLGISFNPFLKTKLIGVLGSSFVRYSGEFRTVYDNYKFRLQNRPDLKDASKLHINNMAIRYTVKMFLNQLYAKWREIEGLEVHPPYHVAKLGLREH